ncbi:MAG: radical SAM protein [Candidatus Bathycorpusculaceae bacterium]
MAVLNDKMARKSLSRYFSVVENEKPAKFMIAKKLPADFSKGDSIQELWHKHARITEEFYKIQVEIDTKQKNLKEIPIPEKSYLDLKIEIAKRVLSNCHLCTRRCGANRIEGNVGFCRCGSEIRVSSIFEHVGEEPELVPSGTIFTMGCTMRCKHCQNWTISQWIEKGETYKTEDLAREVENLRLNGCRNANLVGGEPTPWLQQWLETFKHVNVNVPVVWNSNTYYSPETAQLLAGFVDVYLLDFKYGPSECAERISEAPNYWDVCTRNHLEAKNYGELIIRILVLPNHLECCTKPIINWIAEKLGRETRVNIMFQYRPEWRAYEIPELRRRLTRDEMERAIALAREAKLENFIT